MTAIVGVLNTRGVAFAADSAATHTTKSGSKITNHANKIFTLSKYHPVGVAVYSNLDFEGVPWDTIIKMYRDSQKEKKYATLEEYIKNFWEYIKKNCLPSLLAVQQSNMAFIVNSYCQEVHSIVELSIGVKTAANATQYYNNYIVQLDDFKSKFQNDKAEDFQSYTLLKFRKYGKTSIDTVLAPMLSDPVCPQNFREKFEESVFALLCYSSQTYFGGYTGLVFFGYGEKELYPSYREYKVSYAVDNHIKYLLNSKYIIGRLGDAVVAPFAQTDVTNTVIRAVEDNLRAKFYENNSISLKGFRDEIVAQMSDANAPQQLIDILNALDVEKYANDYKSGMDLYIKEHFTDSLLETVAFLSKEDLADMAESLVRMTCIKRRITLTEETVGGPVDVAVITKGDGFIWMQRKHYFDPDLNPQFFERYNK